MDGAPASPGQEERKPSDQEPEPDRAPSETDPCTVQLTATKEALQQLEERHLRVLAEMENLRRRSLKEKEDAIKFGNAALAKDLLAFIDNLERALQCAPLAGPIDDSGQTASSDVEAFVQGIKLVAKDVVDVLGRHGICKIVSTGQLFDPKFHQAVAEVPSKEGEPTGLVKETLQPGYTLNGRLLRAAMVVVTK